MDKRVEIFYHVIMLGFVLRKTFYDMWDNILRIAALNLGFIAVLTIPVFLPMLAANIINSMLLHTVFSVFGILACSVYLSAAALCVKSISDYGSFGFIDFLRNFKTAWPAGLVMGIFVILLYMVIPNIIWFYLHIESLVGLGLAAIVFWLTIFALLSFQFYFSVYSRLGAKMVKSFNKCMIISMDNSGFSLFLFLNNIVVLIISAVFAFMFPGPVGILLYLDEALRLRLLKYDWLEANPGADRRKIPWDVLLMEEREKTGHRSFMNFIFPWKD